jgi:hypothetical protein
VARARRRRPGDAGHGADRERYLVAFAGAGSWSLLATAGEAAEVWRASWTVADLHAPDRRIWRVAYRGVRVDERVAPTRPSPVQAALGLREALRAAREFASGHDLGMWDGVFEGALERGASDEVHPKDEDLLPVAAFTPESRRLAATADRAWVFGGMGSWNDLSFPEADVQARYEEVSDSLYRSVLNALVAATNSDLAPAR